MATRLLIKVDSWCSVKYEVISYSLPSFCVCVCVCVYVCMCVYVYGGGGGKQTGDSNHTADVYNKIGAC